MELSYEIPIKYLNKLGAYTDIDFCLAHLALSNPVYLSYYRPSLKYKICDNSAFEMGAPMPFDSVLKAAHLLNADEIVCPDSFKNGQKTIDTTAEFIDYLKNIGELGKFKLMGVVQGSDMVDWHNCLNYMNNEPEINVIGFSYVGCSAFDSNLMDARIKAVHASMTLSKVVKPIHLLGIGANPLELRYYEPSSSIRSCDTSIPVVEGLAGNRFDPVAGLTTPKLSRPSNFFDVDIDAQQMDNIIHNISLIRKWADESLKVNL
jgi:hypothetical protein